MRPLSIIKVLVFFGLIQCSLQSLGQTMSASPDIYSGCPGTNVTYSTSNPGNGYFLGIDWSLSPQSPSPGSMSTASGTSTTVTWQNDGTITAHYAFFSYSDNQVHEGWPSLDFDVVGANLSAGTISLGWTRCYNDVATISITGNSGAVTWQKCTSGCSSTNDTGWTTTTNTFTNLFVTTSYRAKLNDATCGVKYSNTINAPTVYPEFTAGTISHGGGTFCPSQDILLSNGVSASGGNGTISYQWQVYTGSAFQDISASGADQPSYTIPAGTIPSGTTKTYRRMAMVSVSCPGTWVPSNQLDVTIDAAFNPGSLPPSQSICSGTSPSVITPGAPSGGSGGYTYVWQVSNDNVNWSVNQASTATYDPPEVINYPTGLYYRRTVTPACGSPGSATIYFAPYVTSAGTISTASTDICYNTEVSFSISGNSTSVSWQKCTSGCSTTDDTGWSSATNPTGNLTTTTKFRGKLSDASCGVKYTNIIDINVNASFNAGSISQSGGPYCSNQSIALSSSANASGGKGTISYQWQQNNVNISGATSATYTIPANTIPVNTTYTYKRGAKTQCETDFVYTSALSVSTYGALSSAGGISSGPILICSGTSPGVITPSSPTGGSGTYTYTWQSAPGTSDPYNESSWSGALASTATYNPGNTSADTYFRRGASSCGGAYLYTNAVLVDVSTTNAGTISNYPATGCYASGTSGSFTISGNSDPVTWQKCTSNCSNDVNWSNMGSNAFSAVTISTQFRAKLQNEICGVKYTPVVQININPGPASTVSPINGLFNSTVTLNATGAGTGETYKWYDSQNAYIGCTGACPSDVLNNSTTYTYYAVLLNSATGCETAYSQKVPLTINVYLNAPTPTISGNSCGPKTVTLPAAPSGVTWYWQGSVSSGESTVTPITTSYDLPGTGPFYIRAKANAINLWSPETILSAQATTTEVADITLNTFDPAYNNILATNSITIGPGFIVPPGATFTAKVAMSPECNDYINWTESTIYNESGIPIGSSKSYFDGLGRSLMSQFKDHLSQKVFASQPLYNIYGAPAANTLSAPLIEKEFIYKRNFVSNTDNKPYSANDFDLRTTTGAAGEINNPRPVGEQPGTLGWYYSASNNIEPLTPVTDYPYARGYTAEGPNPTTSKSAKPGDTFRMGSSHEVQNDRQVIPAGELDHYYELRHHFVSTPSTVNPNLLAFVSTSNISQFTGYYASIASAGGYITVTCNAGSVTPGVWPIGGSVTVTPGKTYTFRVKGYRNTGSTTNVNLYVAHGTAVADFVWPGSSLPLESTNEAWVSNTFTVPAGVTSVRVGLLWNGATSGTVGQSFAIGAVELVPEVPVTSTGYKYTTTDPDGKKSVSFVDVQGRPLATATLTGSTFDNWSYSYYNDLGQLVARVAPKGINTASAAYPQFVTLYKYDHLGRLIETTSTDEGRSQFVYSTDGKIRFSQNQLQYDASPRRFSYTNYDYMGRLIESGEFSSGGWFFEPQTGSPSSSNSILHLIDVVGEGNGVSRKIFGQQSYITDYSYVEYDRQATDFPEAAPIFQENLDGQIAKTENGNSITWYSYDEFGRIVKTWQKITNLNIANPAVIKTIDYTYDYFGNVTEVAYQKNTASDRFYHHYTYDLNNRLTEVRTSKDGVNKTLHAKYQFYLHGPVKKLILANNLQGIDYTYTVGGTLKGINHADPTKDPGADGTDVFGETLHYFDGDYQGAGYNAGNQTLSGYNNYYSGLLKATSWHGPTNNPQSKTYAYQYDSRNQLSNAVWGDMTGTPGSGSYSFVPALLERHRESVGLYDKNGNIENLLRKGKDGNILGDYTYDYEPNTNKLDKVRQGSLTIADYTYNSIGQVIKQDEGVSKTFNITYNVYGRVKEVRDYNNILIQSYHYDDRGNLLQKVTYPALKYTTYISDAAGNVLAIYTQTSTTTLAAQPSEVPVYGAGRIALHKPAVDTYFYEINDHLGNVRAVIGVPATLSYTANMETGLSGSGEGVFNNYGSHQDDVVDHTDNGTLYQKVQLLNGGVNGRVGLAKSFSVSPGDKVKIEVYAKYRTQSGANGTSFLTALGNAFGVSSSSTGEQLKIYNGLNSFASMVPSGEHTDDDDTAPKIFATILLFDKNYMLLDAGWDQINTSAQQVSTTIKTPPYHDFLTREMTVSEPGYAFVFLSNENPTYVDAYFDDLSVTHTQSPIVAGADYYPYGLPMEGREIIDEPYRFGYQGQFSEKDLSTGWNEFELRMYDARFGRWISPDPYGQFYSPFVGMANNPHLGVDPNGGKWIPGPNSLCQKCGWQWVTTFWDVAPVVAESLAGATGWDAGKAIFDNVVVPPSKAAYNAVVTVGGAVTYVGRRFVDGIDAETPMVPTTEGWVKFGGYQSYKVVKETVAETAGEEIIYATAAAAIGPLAKPAVKLLAKMTKPVVKPVLQVAKTAAQEVAQAGFKTLSELGLKDGMKVSSSRALELGEQFLGKGYKEIVPGSGRFVSADGKRVFRMGVNDITGAHGGGPHVNFETLTPNPAKPGKMMVDQNLHIYLTD